MTDSPGEGTGERDRPEARSEEADEAGAANNSGPSAALDRQAGAAQPQGAPGGDESPEAVGVPAPDFPMPSADEPKKPRGKAIAAVGGGLAVLVAGFVVYKVTSGDDDDDSASTSGAGGISNGQGFRGAGAEQGSIDEIDDLSLTLASDNGSMVEVVTNSETVLSETTEGSLSDLNEGDSVRVVGEPGDGGDIIASSLIVTDNPDLLAGGGGPGGGFGGGQPGQPPEGFDPEDFGNGDFEPPDDVELPDDFNEGDGQPPDGAGPRGGFGQGSTGTVTSVGDAITVETDDGETLTADIPADPTVQVVTELDWDDLEVGDEITVIGTADDDATITASAITIGGSGSPAGGFGDGPG